jgi:hypothetical protein
VLLKPLCVTLSSGSASACFTPRPVLGETDQQHKH